MREHHGEVAPLARRASGRLPDDPRPREPLDVGREVARRRERRSAGQQRGARVPVDDLALDRVEERPVLLVVAAAVLTDVDDEPSERLLPREPQDPLREVARVGRLRVRDVDDATLLHRRHRLRGSAVANPERSRHAGWRSGGLPEVRELGGVLPAAIGAGATSRPPCGVSNVNVGARSQPVEHLGADEVVGRALAEAPLVVARDQRPHSRDDVVDRHSPDRDELRTELHVPAADDSQAVGEPVHPHRIEVHRPWVRVEGVEAGVSVALAEEPHQPHQADDQLVALEAVGAGGELVDLPPELVPRHGVVRVRVDALELVGEQPDVARPSRNGGLPQTRPRSRRGPPSAARP